MNRTQRNDGQQALSLEDLDLFREQTENLLEVDEEVYDELYDEAYDEAELAEEELAPASRQRAAARRASRSVQRNVESVSILPMLFFWFGVLVTAAGVFLTIVASTEEARTVIEAMHRAAMGPVHIIFTGIAVAGFAGLQLYHQHTLAQVASTLDLVHEAAQKSEQSQSNLSYLVEMQVENQGRVTASDEDMLRVLQLVQKQDQRINNLSRAVKMYGQPLIEITNRMSDTNQQIGELGKTVGLVKESLEVSSQSLAKSFKEDLGENIEQGSQIAKELSQVLEATRGSALALENLRTELAKKLEADLGKLGQELDRSAKKLMEEVRQSLHASNEKVVAEIKEASGGAPGESDQLADILEQVRAEIAGIGNTSPAAPAKPRSSGPVSKPKAPTATADGPAPDKDPTSTGGNILGAIAKLKKMRE